MYRPTSRLHSTLQHCRFSVWKGIWPVKILLQQFQGFSWQSLEDHWLSLRPWKYR